MAPTKNPWINGTFLVASQHVLLNYTSQVLWTHLLSGKRALFWSHTDHTCPRLPFKLTRAVGIRTHMRFAWEPYGKKTVLHFTFPSIMDRLHSFASVGMFEYLYRSEQVEMTTEWMYIALVLISKPWFTDGPNSLWLAFAALAGRHFVGCSNVYISSTENTL